MHSFLNKVMGALLIMILGLACPGVTWARGGGGGHGGGFGGGGFHGGGFGGYHGGSMGGGFHSFGGVSHGSFSTPHFNSGSAFATHNFGGVNRSGTFARSGNFGLGGVNHFNPAVTPGHFTAGINNHPVNPLAWNHEGNWNRFGGLNRSGEFNRFGEYGRYGRFHDFDDFFYSPFFFAGGWGFGYPDWWSIGPYYGWDTYPYYGSYYGEYYPATTYASTVAYPSQDYMVSGDQMLPSTELSQPGENDWGSQYLALPARRSSKARTPMPCGWRVTRQSKCRRSAKPHQLMSLAGFALKDYRGANMEGACSARAWAGGRLAHAVRVLRRSPDLHQATRRASRLPPRTQGCGRRPVRARLSRSDDGARRGGESAV